MSSKPPSLPNVSIKLPPLVPDDYDDTNPIGIARPEDKTSLIYRPGAKAFFRWYDLWVGAYWDVKHRHLYVCPVPMFGVRFTVPRMVHYWTRLRPTRFSARLFVFAGLIVFFCVLGGFAGGYYISESGHREVRNATSAMRFDAPVPSIRPVATEMIHVLPSASVEVTPEPAVSVEVPKKRAVPVPVNSMPSAKAVPLKNPYDLPAAQSGIVDSRF